MTGLKTRLRSLMLAFLVATGLVTTGLVAIGGARTAMAGVTDHFQKLIIKTPDKPEGLVFIISGMSGWSPAQQAMADALYAKNWITVGVDLALYRAGLVNDTECHHVANELGALSKAIQRAQHLDHYLTPAIIGYGQGGTMAYGALAQSMPQSFSRVISIDPAMALDTPLELCGLDGTKSPKGFSYAAVAAAKLTAPYEVLGGAQATPAAIAERFVIDDTPAVDRADLAKLPIVPLPVHNPGDVMVLFIAGDGGWRDLDKTVGEHLQARGIPVVGLDTLKYFWAEQTPDKLAKDLAKIIKYYSATWKRPKVILAGYSFGADVLPAAYNRLPRSQRQKVTAISLMAISKTANFEIYVGGWVGLDNDDGTPTLPEIQKIPAAKIQCIYGEEDSEDSLCPLLEKTGATIFRTKGGHHFDHDYVTLADRVAKAPRGQ